MLLFRIDTIVWRGPLKLILTRFSDLTLIYSWYYCYCCLYRKYRLYTITKNFRLKKVGRYILTFLNHKNNNDC